MAFSKFTLNIIVLGQVMSHEGIVHMILIKLILRKNSLTIINEC